MSSRITCEVVRPSGIKGLERFLLFESVRKCVCATDQQIPLPLKYNKHEIQD